MIVRQKRFERANGFLRRALIAQVCLLHHILGIHRTPEHTVGDGKEVGTIGFKGFHSASSCESTHENRWSPLCC